MTMHDLLNSLSDDALIAVWNNYAYKGHAVKHIHKMDDLAEIYKDNDAGEILTAILSGYKFSTRNKYVVDNTLDALWSTNYLTDVINIDELAEHIIDEQDDLGNAEIRYLLEQVADMDD